MSYRRLQDIDHEQVWHPFDLIKLPENILIEYGEGAWLWASDGKKYLDAISSWWVNLHGHAEPHLIKALTIQAQKLEHVIFAGFTHEPAIRFVERLLQLLPWHSRAFYSDNGSTSVEVALKMAFQYWYNQGLVKTKVIALEGAYHGDTFGAMSVGGRTAFNNPFNPFLFEVEFIPLPDGRNDHEVIELFRSKVAADDVAAFIYEPLVQGSAGMRMYAPETLDQLMAIAGQHNTFTIADEVMTGFGRTGKLFASEYCENKPDIMCLSKGITGGFMPLGMTTCTEKIYQAFLSDDVYKVFFHGHSYTGNPLACALANASLDLLLGSQCVRQRSMIAASHTAYIQSKKDSKHIYRSLGTILAIELVTIEGSSYFSSLRDQLYFAFLEKGILLRPLGNIIYMIPPYCVSERDLKFVYNTIDEVIAGL